MRAEELHQKFMIHTYPSFRSGTVEFQKTIDNNAQTIVGELIRGATIR